MNQYIANAYLFKALSDPNRLMIVDMLSCGELCACRILERFRITQPTLSHHMKTLCDCGLVLWRKEGRCRLRFLHWMVVPPTICTMPQKTCSTRQRFFAFR